MSKLKSVFIKLTMLTAICLIAGFSFFVINNKTSNANTSNDSTINAVYDDGLKLSWTKETQSNNFENIGTLNNKVKAINVATLAVDHTYYTVSENIGNVEGGSEISYNYINPSTINELSYNLDGTITIGSSTATFTSKPGYAIVGYRFGNSTSNNTITYTHYTLNLPTGFSFSDIKNKEASCASEIDLATAKLNNGVTLTPEDMDPEYNGKLVFQALVVEIEYPIVLAYRYTDSSNYEDYKTYTYSIGTPATFDSNPTFPEGKPADLAFGRWMLNIADLINIPDSDIDKNKWDENNYCVEYDANNNKLTISCDDYVNLTFENVIRNPYNPLLFYVSNVKGYGQIIDYQKQPQNSSNKPMITAKWSKIYDLIIDNTNEDSGIKDKAGKYLSMIKSSLGENNENYTTTTLKILDSNQYAYPFMSSEVNETGLSFMKIDEFESNPEYRATVSNTNNWYYLYRYGYYIAGYKFSFKINNVEKYLTYTDTGWDVLNGDTTYILNGDTTDISINNLPNKSIYGVKGLSGIALFAEQMDEISGTSVAAVTNITMKPVWQKVKIDVKTNNTSIMLNQTADGQSYSKSYDTPYGLSDVAAPSGQSLICYTYDENNDNALIAKSGTWNYKNIPYDKFATYVEQNGSLGAGTYILPVTPVFLDNIYRVNLTGFVPKDGNKYILDSTKTEFKYVGSKYVSDVYTYDNFPYDAPLYDDWQFKTYEEYFNDNNGDIDNYIVSVQRYISNFNEGIDGDGNSDLNIFKHIWYNQDNVEFVSETQIVGDTDMWIYLANNQITGRLPVFERKNFELIFWENAFKISTMNPDEQYAYKTACYVDNTHSEEIDSFISHDNGIWCYSDGTLNKSNVEELKAHYFRKNYVLDVATVLATKGVGQYGYVKIEITDTLVGVDPSVEDQGGTYLAIYNKGGMKYYEFASKTFSKQFLDNANPLTDKIKVYDGCSIKITVYDQSKNSDAMKSGDFDSMIGYKFDKAEQTLFAGKNQRNSILNFDDNSDKYIYDIPADSITALNYANASTIDLDIYFAPIEYTFKVVMDDHSGQFQVSANGSKSPYINSYDLDKVTVVGENKYNIYTRLFAGYKLQYNAFVLNNGLVLQYYKDIENTTSSQDYFIASGTPYFYGTWLRLYFYKGVYSDFDISYTRETITIQTESIEFDFNLKIYDSYTKQQHDVDVQETLKLNNGTTYTNEIYTYLTNESAGWIYEEEGSKYVLMSSRMYFPNKALTNTNDNHYTEYDFILKSKPTNKFLINSTMLSKMVRGYNDGKIIPVDNRDIYFMFEVRSLLEITLKTDDTYYNTDTNSTTRTAIITNGDNNSIQLELNSGSVFDESVVGYTYQGATNKLLTSFDNKRYLEDEEVVGATLDNNNSFVSVDNTTITVRFVPKPLSVIMVYKIGGNIVSREAMNDYIAEETLPVSVPGEYYISNVIEYMVKAKHNDYDLFVTINDNYQGSTNNTERRWESSYTLTDSDWDFEKVEIIVELAEKDNSNITIRFKLQDAKKGTSTDLFGHITVKDEYTSLATSTSTDGLDNSEYLSFNIVEDRQVSVKVEVFDGYYIVGYKQNAGDVQQITLVNNEFIMIDKFNSVNDYGDYYIIIEKYLVDVILDDGETIGEYAIDGKQKLNDYYVGKEISLSYKETEGERFVNFYYLAKVDSSNRYTGTDLDYLEYRKSDGTLNKVTIPANAESITITSELLTKANFAGGTNNDSIIYLGVDVIKQCKLDYEIIGENYATDIVIKNGDVAYSSGLYCDVYTPISLKVITLVEGKYNIKVTNNITGRVDNYDILNTTITLTENKDITIEIYPKTFGVSVDENVYATLADLTDGADNVPANERVNALLSSGQRYDEMATISFVRIATDRELAEVFITNDNGTIAIIFDHAEFKAYNVANGVVDYDNEIDLITNGFTLTIENNRVKIQYVTKCNVSLVLNYKLYKSIITL